MGAAFATQNLSKGFRNVPVLDGLTFEALEGSVFGLIGPNGAGKTTTIKILMNIVKPSSGCAKVLGVDSRRLSPEDFTQIGYVSENQEMPDWMTIDYLMAYLKPFYPTWEDGYAAGLIRQFGLPRDRKLRHLSRGMRMKTALVSALAYRPKVLVLDEPFSGLDPLVREDLIEGLLEWAGGITTLISSHDLADIESFASHIGYLDRGRLQFSEEMNSLTTRFREVEVVVESNATPPADSVWPQSWLRREVTSSLVRFVESRFEPERTTGEIRRLFGEVRQISVNPMPLKAIFIALARNASKAA